MIISRRDPAGGISSDFCGECMEEVDKMDRMKKCNRCGNEDNVVHLWMGKQWCETCFQKQTGLSVEVGELPVCPLCGEELLASTSYPLQQELICMHCLLRLGPERAQILLKVNKLNPAEIAAAVKFLRELLTRNQILRLREAINYGGRNWWVKLPDFGEYICRKLMDQSVIPWDGEVLDEVWDRLIEEAVEE